MKKKFLVEDLESVEKLLNTKFGKYDFYPAKKKDSYVYTLDDEISYVLEIYNKNLKGLNLLFVLSKEETNICEELKYLEEVSDDKRYSKKYLKEFGNPKEFDFSLEEVFKKCDSVGLARMDLNFQKAMSDVKVIKALLYRLNQLLKLHLEQTKDRQKIESLLDDIVALYMLAKGIFDKKFLKNMMNFLLNKEYFIQEKEIRNRYFLNFEAFIYDMSGFYEEEKSQDVVYYFVKSALYKILEKNGVGKKDFITIILYYFSSLFKQEELDFITLQLEHLKFA
jgi:hypothetical protein